MLQEKEKILIEGEYSHACLLKYLVLF